ncbi:MAG TPA: DUF3606 domain-containing protein, partial [Chitinophagales bacterium]|nr:DUF3606 domain-containing protein [Chitinophagales bacterium]
IFVLIKMKIMTYETSNTAPRYSTKININEPHDVKYWAREFEISSTMLMNIVDVVGTSSNTIRLYLMKKRFMEAWS